MAFIDLTNVEIIDAVSSDAKVLIVEDDEIKITAIPDLSKVEVVEEVGEDAKMLVVENGEIKRVGMPSSGTVGNVHDAVIKYNRNDDTQEVIYGSYNAISAKIQAGEYVSIMVYADAPPYHSYPCPVKHIMWDDEGYYIRVECDMSRIGVDEDHSLLFIFAEE